MAMRHLLIALLSLALAGCWVGDRLFADKDARTALVPGLYRVSVPDEKPGEVRISVLRNGLTQMADSDGTGSDVYGFAPLDPQQGTFVAWHSDDKTSGSAEGEQFYFLGQRRNDGSFGIYLPFCSGAEAQIARRAGASIEGVRNASKPNTCRFSSRSSLENALRKLRPSDQKRMMTLVLERADRPNLLPASGGR
jgi:hypothetical protein